MFDIHPPFYNELKIILIKKIFTIPPLINNKGVIKVMIVFIVFTDKAYQVFGVIFYWRPHVMVQLTNRITHTLPPFISYYTKYASLHGLRIS
ncbi:hypothetical protein A3860_12150 [Niastella vici]|uniref:Uncharacterized protein n=1 Tax=Niastella vici TaxID=1703345 RepID=A0A1V9G6H7_9BACT|nr:hypothetical protein A3860_12150 [Niastella vici]